MSTFFRRSPPVAASEIMLMKIRLLSFFFHASKEKGSNENYDNNIEIMLKFELPIVAEITLTSQNEILKLKSPWLH